MMSACQTCGAEVREGLLYCSGLSPLVYLAHSLGADEPGRTANIARAMRWYQYLFRYHPEVAVTAPWLLSARVAEKTAEDRARGMAMNERILPLCSEVWLCGDRVSPGMLAEARLAQSNGIPVRSLVCLGAAGEPPEYRCEPVAWSEA